MDLIRKIGEISVANLGSDNILMLSVHGKYLLKREDYSSRKTQTPIRVYPITRETIQTQMVPVFLAILTERDYDNVMRKPRES